MAPPFREPFVRQAKDKKILVFRYKPKKRVRKLNGHRQPYAEVKDHQDHAALRQSLSDARGDLLPRRPRSPLPDLRARGHADFADHGKDIVCAAVSAVLQAAHLGLREYARAVVTSRQEPGELELRLREDQRDLESVRAILATAELAVEQIARRFPSTLRLTKRDRGSAGSRGSGLGNDRSKEILRCLIAFARPLRNRRGRVRRTPATVIKAPSIERGPRRRRRGRSRQDRPRRRARRIAFGGRLHGLPAPARRPASSASTDRFARS